MAFLPPSLSAWILQTTLEWPDLVQDVSKITRIYRVALVIVIQICISLAVLELFGRLFDPFGVSYYPEMARYLDTLIVEEPIGYRNKPGLIGNFFGTTVRINSHGMRDKEISQSTDPGTFRILFLGDSVPFGIGVEEEDSLPSQLERIANANAVTGEEYEVLNMGVPSYNTEQELIQLKTIGLDLKPDLVLLLFSRNDIEPKMWVLEKRSGWIKDLIQRSYAGSLLFLAYREFKARFPSIISPSHASSRLEDDLSRAFAGYHADAHGWQKVRNSLSEINAILQGKSIPFVVFLNQENQSLVNMLGHEAQLDGFHIFHLLPRSDERWMSSNPRKYVNSITDGHPNTEGNTILATLIYEKLVKSGLIQHRDRGHWTWTCMLPGKAGP
jgi:hypothetical protein